MKRHLALLLAALMISMTLYMPFALAEDWVCPSCGRSNQLNFCTECGTQKPEQWACPFCGKSNQSNFCTGCGKQKPEQWACPFCGKVNQLYFCTECGAQKPEEASASMAETPDVTAESQTDPDESLAVLTNGLATLVESLVTPAENVAVPVESLVDPANGFVGLSDGLAALVESLVAPFESVAVTAETLAIPTGTWEFPTLGVSFFLTIRDNSEYTFIIQGGGRIAGNYENIAGNIAFISDGKPLFWGNYNAADDTFTIGEVGKGHRTETVPIFKLRNDSESMNDTIEARQILSVECRNVADLQRFDIVVTNFPDRGDTLFVKRLVGLPGDTVELNGGYLYINGEKYDEPYIPDEYRHGSLNNMAPVNVPEGCYFVIGDHRNNSNDSRNVGSIPADLMVGVVTEIDGKPAENSQEAAYE